MRLRLSAHFLRAYQDAPADIQKGIRFFQPEEFVAYLEDTEVEAAGTEEMVKGYKVRVRYSAVDASERQARQQAIAKVIMQAFKRMKSEVK